MKYGIVSYNMHGNFTNYGSALQSYALQTAINRLENTSSVIIDYVPDVLKDKEVLNPMKNMWDVDDFSRHCCELSMPAIQENYRRFLDFYSKKYSKTSKVYTSSNFNETLSDEQLDGYVCGSDTIWCITEFHGFDDGYFGNYEAMKKTRTVSYAASFGDIAFSDQEKKILVDRLHNFKMIGIRENTMIDFIRNNVSVPVERVIDPTLLLSTSDYEKIMAPRLVSQKYVLLYSRRYNEDMEKYADELAKILDCIVVEISLRAVNSYKHKMYYEAGVDEFLSLTKHAEYVVTNSYHGAIFAIQMRRPFSVFSREQANTKIPQMLSLLDLSNRFFTTEKKAQEKIDYDAVSEKLSTLRQRSMLFLKEELSCQ